MELRHADYENLIARLERGDSSAEELAAIRKEAAQCLRDALQRIAQLEHQIANMQRAIRDAVTETGAARDA
ncbi:hypothetical protein ACFPL7_11730 [Dongia soli]|uniref:Uncharacterized protein n=1 Tax=Dongia soli TaxID=600628 RepID=A0ABU5EI42_9PROT|nr:hypothetical protein [Dongia soli]MDY0885519.1 hypothetical protein [Dongia soli]